MTCKCKRPGHDCKIADDCSVVERMHERAKLQGVSLEEFLKANLGKMDERIKTLEELTENLMALESLNDLADMKILADMERFAKSVGYKG